MNDNSVAMKNPLREKLQRDTEAFFAAGRQINVIPTGVRAEDRDWGEHITGLARSKVARGARNGGDAMRMKHLGGIGDE